MLSLTSISLSFDGQAILNQIDLTIEAGQIVCLLGASGCGKTTLLRIIAGLERGYHGQVLLHGQAIDHFSVSERHFGLMFQDFALFPHLNVFDNVAFGLKMQGVSGKERLQRVNDVLTIVGLGTMGKRDVTGLSGGEKQRVALARSLAPQPQLLMLDEPLGSLDANLRHYLVQELREKIVSLGLTAIYVTHDQQEAFAIADKVAVMKAGSIEQFDTPEALYYTPRTRYVSEFLGLPNILPVTLIENGLAHYALGTIETPIPIQYVSVHPNAFLLNNNGDFVGTLRERQFLGDHYRVAVDVKDTRLSFRVPSFQFSPQQGDTIRFDVNSQQVVGLVG